MGNFEHMTHDMTPTERQAAMIADLEARIILLTDDLFYARASIARMSVELEQANRQLAHRDAEIAMLRATSDKLDDKPAERPINKTVDEIQHIKERLREGFFYPFIREKEILKDRHPTFLTPESQPVVLAEALCGFGSKLTKEGTTEWEKKAGHLLATGGVAMRVHERTIGEALRLLEDLREKLTARKEAQP
jgi:hypothetical protein